MKKIILTGLFYFLCVGFGYSQQLWAPAGATWYYQEGWMSGQGYSKRTVDKDTIINGFPGKKIKAINYSVNYPFLQLQVYTSFQYFYNDSGVIMGGAVPNAFDTVYNYNAVPGDKWSYPYPGQCGDTSFITVTDTGTMIISNQALKYKAMVFTGGYFKVLDTLVERIGFLHNDPFSTAFHCTIDGGYIALCSYHDSLISAYPNLDSICTVLPTAVVTVQPPGNLLSIYPNPAIDVITISMGNENEEQELSVYDLQGRILFTRRFIAQTENKVNVYDLPIGIFLAEIKSRNGVKRQLFVKQ